MAIIHCFNGDDEWTKRAFIMNLNANNGVRIQLYEQLQIEQILARHHWEKQSEGMSK